jgi:arylsulfatase
MQGESLLPAIKGEQTERQNNLYWKWARGKAMLKDQWKIVKHEDKNPWELYNLTNDPVETNNLAEEFPAIVAEMDSLFRVWED